MGIQKAGWKFLSVKRDELRFSIPLFLLYFLSGSFYTFGQIYTETLFLKSYGAQGLSRFFVYNGFLLIFCGILYNFFMLRFTLRKGYLFLVVLFTAMILLSSRLPLHNHRWLPFALYLGNYLFTFFLDLHFFNFIFLYLNIRNAKRIVPFIMGGGKLGGIISGIAVFSVLSGTIADAGAAVWGINGALLLVPMLFLGRGSASHKTAYRTETEDMTAGTGRVGNIMRRIRFSYSSPIFTWSVVLVFIMSVANQLSEYYFMSVFNQAFATRAELASFLGIYTFSADLITLLVQLFAVSALIRKLGVPGANLVYPVSFIGFMSLMALYPALFAGTLLRFFRKNLSLLIRTPVFNIIMASSPRDRMAEVKSFINGIISPLGMVCGGLLIHLLVSRFTGPMGYGVTLGIGVLFIICAFIQNRAYVRSLKSRISVALSPIDAAGPAKLYDHINAEAINDETFGLVEKLFMRAPSLDLAESLSPHFERLSPETREQMLMLAAHSRAKGSERLLEKSLGDPSPRVRGAALGSLRGLPFRPRLAMLDRFYTPALRSEHHALTILGSRAGLSGELDKDIDIFAAEKVRETQSGVMKGECDPEEFIILTRILSPPYFLMPLCELALATGNPRLFEHLIPHAGNVPRATGRRLLYCFKNAPIEYLEEFLLHCGELTQIDRALLLDYREYIPYEHMGRLFRPDGGVTTILLGRLIRHRKFFRVINYLNYFLSLGIKPEREITGYIDYTIDTLNHLYNARNILCASFRESMTGISSRYAAFVTMIINDAIEKHKHLILKSLAVLTGTDVEEVYESNLFLKDQDLNSYLLEFIETSGKTARRALTILDDERTEKGMIQHIRARDAYALLEVLPGKMRRFIPEVFRSFTYSISMLRKRPSAGKTSQPTTETAEDKDMPSTIEKMVLLKNTPLFRDLTVNDLVHIAGITREIRVPRDQILIREGDSGDELFILIEGTVRVYTRARELESLGPGSCIGELTIIDKEPRSANVRTTSRCRLLSIKRVDFLLTLRENPSISINIMQVMAQRLRRIIAS